MHELGIVLQVAKTLDEVCEEQHIVKIGSVTLEIGEVSGVINDYFIDCWDYFKEKHERLKEATMTIETIQALNFCEDCKREYPAIPFGRVCPRCGSEHTYLLQGNEVNIKEITAETE